MYIPLKMYVSHLIKACAQAKVSIYLINRCLPSPCWKKGIMVLEIKFNEFLPGYIRRAFDGIEATRSAISKYAICRKYDL